MIDILFSNIPEKFHSNSSAKQGIVGFGIGLAAMVILRNYHTCFCSLNSNFPCILHLIPFLTRESFHMIGK